MTYDFAIDFNKRKLLAGIYKLDLAVTDVKANGWQFTEDFEMTKDDTKKVNEVIIGDSENDYNGVVNSWLFCVSYLNLKSYF